MQLVQWILGLLVLLGVIGYVAVPSFQQVVSRTASSAVSALQRIVNPQLDPIRPTTITASDQVKGHPVAYLFDKYANTDWRANGDQPTVTVKFAETFDLGALIIHSGSADNFTATRRPSKLLLTFPNGTTTEIDLKDDNASQTFTVEASHIDGFQIQVMGTFGPPGTPVTISEIEVFAKR